MVLHSWHLRQVGQITSVTLNVYSSALARAPPETTPAPSSKLKKYVNKWHTKYFSIADHLWTAMYAWTSERRGVGSLITGPVTTYWARNWALVFRLWLASLNLIQSGGVAWRFQSHFTLMSFRTMHKGGLKPDSFHFCFRTNTCWRFVTKPPVGNHSSGQTPGKVPLADWV